MPTATANRYSHPNTYTNSDIYAYRDSYRQLHAYSNGHSYSHRQHLHQQRHLRLPQQLPRRQQPQLHPHRHRRLQRQPTPTATATATATPTPAVTTNPATNVASVSATLNGSVNPRGSTTTVYFQWGTTTSYGHTTAMQTKTGNTSLPITANISGLSASHYFIISGL